VFSPVLRSPKREQFVGFSGLLREGDTSWFFNQNRWLGRPLRRSFDYRLINGASLFVYAAYSAQVRPEFVSKPTNVKASQKPYFDTGHLTFTKPKGDEIGCFLRVPFKPANCLTSNGWWEESSQNCTKIA